MTQRVAVGVLAADGHVEQFVPELSRSAFSPGSSASASSRISGSGSATIFRGFGDLGVELLEAAILGRQLGQRAVLAGDGRDLR